MFFEGFGTKDVKTRSFDFLVCGYEYICSTVQSVIVLIRNPRNDWGLPLNRSVYSKHIAQHASQTVHA